ncbi:hypothetical protein [Vibrio sp. SCSIO 43137]|uniref:hypothetical protein n=1 Tax=Vibrio sp. SCSIO 43137 TaxID=3021011 RepID=UPI0023077698|nr:hypothetical protein [Vibrio sp. SCSIO 43137]WCE31843.1 hypothetical protein PK654_22220 [Vibrio sp. SCSIO 43137]
MKLAPSLLATAAIFATVWGLVLFQPVTTEAKPVVTTSAAVSKSYLKGLTKEIPLSDVSQLWQQFFVQYGSADQLLSKTDRIIVLYQSFNSDFSQAKVTIGYQVSATADKQKLVALPLSSKQLLKRGKYDTNALVNAWSEIDYQREVGAVIEIHYFNQQGVETGSEVSVSYQ